MRKKGGKGTREGRGGCVRKKGEKGTREVREKEGKEGYTREGIGERREGRD